VPTADGSRHFFNPSNLALSVTFLLYPSIGLAMPWMWTTELSGFGDWIFPIIIFVLGTMLHLKYASRIWVVLSFLVAFAGQAIFRGLCFEDTNLFTALGPATGVPAAIFTFYMAPDPATSPSGKREQILFGSSIAVVYMILMMLHVVYALFYALTVVCLLRGLYMAYVYLAARGVGQRERRT
jgi:Na+-translocating ferredoxin:NAD+ oxidoreductase RnfD subunit